jgi:hypothetical protein
MCPAEGCNVWYVFWSAQTNENGVPCAACSDPCSVYVRCTTPQKFSESMSILRVRPLCSLMSEILENLLIKNLCIESEGEI